MASPTDVPPTAPITCVLITAVVTLVTSVDTVLDTRLIPEMTALSLSNVCGVPGAVFVKVSTLLSLAGTSIPVWVWPSLMTLSPVIAVFV
ncbi:hypothetical protein D3C74_438320 [compost metagenome]